MVNQRIVKRKKTTPNPPPAIFTANPISTIIIFALLLL
jgi:hypothetical protein